MKKVYTVVLVVVMLLSSSGYASADGPVGADCTNPPSLVPFANLKNCDLSGRNMEGVDLSNADLGDANLLGAKRRTGTHLTGATWGNTTCSDGSNSDDNDGDNFTCESNFLLNQPPTVSLTSTANNTTVNRGANVTLSARLPQISMDQWTDWNFSQTEYG